MDRPLGQELTRLCVQYISLVEVYRAKSTVAPSHVAHVAYITGILECFLDDMTYIGYVEPGTVDLAPGQDLNTLCAKYIAMIKAYQAKSTLEPSHVAHVAYITGMIECLSSDMADIGYIDQE